MNKLQPNILLIYTGGTIGMIKNANTGALKSFDFNNLSYISSQGIAALASWHQILADKGGKLIFIGVRGNVFDVLNVVGLAQIFTFCSSMEEAKIVAEDWKSGA